MFPVDRNPVTAMLLMRRFKDRVATRLLKRGFASFGPGSQIALPLHIKSDATGVSIGAGCRIGAGCSMWLGPAGSIELGDGVVLMSGVELSAESKIVIEDRVVIARNVTVVDNQHTFSDPDTPIWDQGVDRIAPITLRRGAWVATAATILPGVTVGRNARVGANAVVTQDVPDNTTVVGVPAAPVSPA